MGTQIDDLQPMLLTATRQVPADPGAWLAEIKYDGYRLLAQADPDGVQLRSRGGTDASVWYPEIGRALSGLGPGRHVLDGEACVLDELGRSDFNRLHERSMRRRWVDGAPPVAYVAFDLLVHDGKDIRALPLLERKARLADLLTPAPLGVLRLSHLPGAQAGQLYQAALQLKLEGIVLKRLNSPYIGGEPRSRYWLKMKRPGATPAGRFKRDAI